MIVRYRVIEDWLADEGVWFPWGVFYENRSDDFADYTLLIRAIPDDDRRKGRYFDRRIQELRPSIEEAEVVLGEYADRYRVRPEIRTVKSTSRREIRALLWEVISEEIEKRMAECQVEYAMPEPAYVALREGSEEED
ncbi:MAG: hypothetical protein IMY75_04615 [Chloroflexi bacterium]|nr:hypothetical protein [Chloroflexota bacterium]